MIDGTIISVIPPILASIVTYAISTKKSRLVQLKAIAEIQDKAIQLVQRAEEQMRLELHKEIDRIREENNTLRHKIEELESQRHAIEQVSNSLYIEVQTLREALNHYKQIVDDNKHIMDSNKKELDYLRDLSNNKGVNESEQKMSH